MTPAAQSIVFFAVMLGLSVFCTRNLVRALHRQAKAAPDTRRVLAPYLTLCAAMHLTAAIWLPHVPHGGALRLLVPLCVFGLPAMQHCWLLATAVQSRAR